MTCIFCVVMGDDLRLEILFIFILGQRQPVQEPPQSTEVMHKQIPKTLDSLFANMKEQRMRAFPHSNNGNGSGGVRRHGGGGNQPRQPWLRGRFGNYRNR